MKSHFLFILFLNHLLIIGQNYSDQWVAVDGEGRVLPTHSEVGDLRSDKIVGVFYYIWLGGHPSQMQGIYDITKILDANTDNPQYGPVGQYHLWGEPEYGYFRSEDPYVIRHDMQMLSNAKVDFIYFDVTNSFTYLNTVRAICDVSLAMRQEGMSTPDIVFLTNANSGSVMTSLYNDFYSDNTYQDLWFYWEGKPLILGQENDPNLSNAAKNFFTIKYSWAWTNAANESNHWQWHDLHPQDFGWSVNPNTPDQIPVSVASHPTINIGKSYNKGSQPSVNSDYVTQFTDQGLFFQEQWDRALSVDPKIVMVSQWNEWVALRLNQNGDDTFAGRPVTDNTPRFVDVFSREFNRDIAPMKGGYTDNYYYQLIANIRRFKGMEAPQAENTQKTISIDGDFSDWDSVRPEYRDARNDNVHRNFDNYNRSAKIINTWGRNDILQSKAASDASNIYFFVETFTDITPHTDPRWMYLLIDIDKNKNTGWEGYDYIMNQQVNTATSTTLSAWNNGSWQQIGNISYSVNGKNLEVSIPRNLLGLVGSSPNFYFKWADNPNNLSDISSFFSSGDSAPDRRFNYHFQGSSDTNCISSVAEWNMNTISEFGNNPSTGISDLSVSEGIMSYNTGVDPYLSSQDNLNYCTSNSILQIRIKNATSVDALRFFFTTNASPDYSMDKSVEIPISANDSDFMTYTVDMNSNENWTGILKRLRVDAPDGSANGTVAIDYIKIGSDTVLDIDDVESNEKDTIILSPIPIENILSISGGSSNMEIKIFDISGAVKITKRLKDKNTSVDVSSLASGFYLIGIMNLNNQGEHNIYKMLKN